MSRHQAMLAAAKAAGSGASSMYLRWPRASRNCRSTAHQGAGRKRSSSASALDWSIVRPPAVYGPGDKETLDLFKMAAAA